VTEPWNLESLVIQDSILVCSPDPRIPHTAEAASLSQDAKHVRQASHAAKEKGLLRKLVSQRPSQKRKVHDVSQRPSQKRKVQVKNKRILRNSCELSWERTTMTTVV
jgi:hypothetical protein